MKFVTVGFATAVLVFAVASAMSEMLLTKDATPIDGTIRRKNSREKTAVRSVRSSRGLLDAQRSETVSQDSKDQTVELQRTLNSIRERESEVLAKQDALQIILKEIREEQQSVDVVRRQVSEEIAARIDADVPSTSSLTRTADSKVSTRPIVSMRDSQAVRDTAVLVNRLARDGTELGFPRRLYPAEVFCREPCRAQSRSGR